MYNEIQDLDTNQTWMIIDLPPNKIVIGSKWIYKVKYNYDGSIDTYRVILIEKGYT